MTRRSVLIEALQSAPRDLARLLRPIDAAAALWRPVPDEWCVADVVAHLSYCEAPYLARLRRVVEQDNPFEAALLPDESAHDLAHPLAELLEIFVARRAETVAFLSSLDQRDWGRALVHATIGPTKLRDQVQELVAHDNLHLEQIVTLRERLEAAS
jgi:uncharacterized damage-inducible protein DinB